MSRVTVLACLALALTAPAAIAADHPDLGLTADADFFQLPPGANFGPCAGVAVNSKGHVFVFHRGQHKLMEFDADGAFVRSLGDGLFSKPHGLHIDGEDNIWATDTGDHLVLKLSPEGRLLMVLGVVGQKGLWHETYDTVLFDQPTDVTTAPDGTIYITDGYGNSRMLMLSPGGEVLRIWGEKGDAPSQFASPHNVVVVPDGRLVMTDRDNARIQVFTAAGDFVEAWGGFKVPNGLELTSRGTLLLTDSGLEQVLELDLRGNVVGAFGGKGRGPGRFGLAHGIALAGDGSIFVTEILNWRVQRLLPKK